MEQKKELDLKNIGRRIRKEREKLGLSREGFAEIIGLSDYYIGQLERGERQMSLPVLVNVARCIHVSLDYLVFGKPTQGGDYIFDAGSGEYDASESSSEIFELIGKCSPQELALVKKLFKTILPYIQG